ncbi:unnamed protein product [Euphydryas editha]|uniref:THAP-type domain-containing protein n=1 Tax=Euphydryas editha TaxID=104508 RepID=A0AAU9TDG7_EUPED|nr:unnamed protein product [Euphydryas editha]
MVHTTCAVRDCTSSSRINKDLKFHQFPHTEERCKLWIDACRRFDLVEKTPENLKNMYICSLHFQEQMYGKSSLKKTAIPVLHLPNRNTYSVYTQTDPTNRGVEIKEEITVEENPYLCRICLSVGRKMFPLEQYGTLYKKLLSDKYQDQNIVSLSSLTRVLYNDSNPNFTYIKEKEKRTSTEPVPEPMMMMNDDQLEDYEILIDREKTRNVRKIDNMRYNRKKRAKVNMVPKMCSEDVLREAVTAIHNGMSVYKASLEYNISESMLRIKKHEPKYCINCTTCDVDS